jgi:hypothetical protein
VEICLAAHFGRGGTIYTGLLAVKFTGRLRVTGCQVDGPSGLLAAGFTGLLGYWPVGLLACWATGRLGFTGRLVYWPSC